MVKTYRFGLALALSAVLFVCAVSSAATELVFTHWGSNPGIEAAIENFNATHPDIQIRFEPVGWGEYFDKVPIQIAAGSGPDIFSVHYTNMPVQKWGPDKLLLDLTGLWERDKGELDEDDWFPFVLDALTYKGRLYAFPYGWAVFGHLIYNTEMFSEFGLVVPDSTWDWNTLRAAAVKFNKDTDGDGTLDRFGLAKGNYNRMRLLRGHIWSAGGTVFNEDETKVTLNDEGALRAMEFVANLFNEGVIPPNASSWIWNGDVAMNAGLGIQHMLNLFKDERSWTPNWTLYPKDPVTGGRQFVALPESFGVSATTKHAEEAWEFLKWFTSTEGYARSSYQAWGFVQFLPVRRSTAMSNYFLQPDPNRVPEVVDMMVAIEMADHARMPVYDNPSLAMNQGEIEKIFDNEWKKVTEQTQSVAQFIANVQKMIDPLLR